MSVRVRPLECGWLNTDLGTMLAGRIAEFRLPVASFLVEHDRGTLVFDTGMHPDLVHGSSRLGPIESMYDVELGSDGLLGARLSECGVDRADVDRAVLSHLHFDHCGGLAEVPDARIVVQTAEWAAAQDPLMAELGVYHPPDFHTGQEVEQIDGRVDLFGDGSVVTVPTPGHTPGHQSLLIEGRLLLVGDACYCRLALDEDALPPVVMDEAQQRAGFAWLREQEAAGIQLVFSHDPVQWVELPAQL